MNRITHTIRLTCSFLALTLWTNAQTINNPISLDAGKTGDTISRHIYGQFSEHLGHCIYGGIWVGENSPIPNTRGIRNDVVAALKRINIPNLRWPGGCFADEYHWMDGIGPRDKRPKMVNTNWGGVVEDNSFGTHEFLDLCEQLGTEPYISGNLGSGTVEEMSKWVEYITFDGESPMANLRKQNGHAKPWKVKFWGVGNENWGCGGNMRPEFYADNYRRYATYCKNYGNNKLLKIAGGPSDSDYNWMEVMMKNIPQGLVGGISLHSYTLPGSWGKKGSATIFDEKEYFTTIQKTLYMEDRIIKHSAIMDKYDSKKKIGLMVDEWGSWYDVEPGTNPGFLFQQNTLRDALIAGINLNIFNNHCDRVKLANIAQVINVLQAMIFTDGDKMVLTPSFYVFEMYKVHHDAALIPLQFESPLYTFNDKKIPAVSASASRDKKGVVHITLTNADPKNEQTLDFALSGTKATTLTGKILTAKELNTCNTFEKPDALKSEDFKGAKLNKENLTVKLPAKSVVMIELK
jgi:alpha-N-arabinofuranosidase